MVHLHPISKISSGKDKGWEELVSDYQSTVKYFLEIVVHK